MDGFGLYRNMYRSLMGYNLLPAELSYHERNNRVNVLSITLSPHGSTLGTRLERVQGTEGMNVAHLA